LEKKKTLYSHKRVFLRRKSPNLMTLKAMVQIFQEHFDPRNALKRYRIHDLKSDAWYFCKQTQTRMSGEQLEKIGFRIRLEREDFHVYTLEWCICK
ncbi:GH36 C-terminal domain-containing protein, partial [Erysipelotrichaceae bacterium 66-17]